MVAARSAGALTISFANNADAPLSAEADNGITLDTGSEVISGSTRLKAGTAQKIVLNIFSSAAMVRLNKAYGNLMVDLKATNAKLMRRTINLTILATGTDEATAREMLEICEFQVKVAIVAIKTIKTVDAEALLAETKDFVCLAMARWCADASNRAGTKSVVADSNPLFWPKDSLCCRDDAFGHHVQESGALQF